MENDETSLGSVEEHDANKRSPEGNSEGEIREVPDVLKELQDGLQLALSQKKPVYAIVHKDGTMFPVLADERIHVRLLALETMGFNIVPVTFPDPNFRLYGESVDSLFVAADDEGWALRGANRFLHRRRKELERKVDELNFLKELKEAVFGL